MSGTLSICWVYATLDSVSPPKNSPERPIYNRIAVLRAEHAMSRVQLAELVKVNRQTIGALERGDHYPSLDLAFRICEVFELPVEAVFSREEFTPMSSTLYRSPTGSEGE
ncbi:helix-turn-helix transcriptional regulator [Corynebacterium sp. H78]|uniref:helix-turn-helix transcriptional regulator n=1 Tax=Corynebacterium sp. H78 TaxID=3133417 RepID=UPI00403F70F0